MLFTGGNWEFEWYVECIHIMQVLFIDMYYCRYTNNRSNSFVEDGILYIKPTLTADAIGHEELKQGGYLNLWYVKQHWLAD